jgi:hypothetical protein
MLLWVWELVLRKGRMLGRAMRMEFGWAELFEI